jgi:hypothetical protein
LLTRLPVGLLGLLLLVLPTAPVARVATPTATGAARVTLERTELPSSPPSLTVQRSPLFDDLPGAGPTPVTVAVAAPDVDDEARLRNAVAAALPTLGGEVGARWGTPSAVGPVLEVRWRPGEPLDAPPAVQQAVERVVETVISTADRLFPGGFRTGDGAPLAAIRVVLPGQDDVLVAVRTYREYAAGDSTPEEFARQWRLLRRESTETRPAPPAARLIPQGPTDGAPDRWPPRVARFHAEIMHAAYTYQIDPAVLAAVMQQESGGDPYATGAWAWIPHMGRYERAIGLMQVMPNEAERRGVGLDEAWDPEANILLGARVLRDKLTVIRGDFWTRVQGYYGFGDPLSDYWLDRVYAYWLAFRDPPTGP